MNMDVYVGSRLEQLIALLLRLQRHQSLHLPHQLHLHHLRNLKLSHTSTKELIPPAPFVWKDLCRKLLFAGCSVAMCSMASAGMEA